MREFAHKKSLPSGCHVGLEQAPSGTDCLHIDDPVVLARFISFVKSKAPLGTEIFMRGQDKDHPGMVPSLFRRCAASEAAMRAAAYSSFIGRANAALGYGRFRRDNLGALLQHYGYHTPWLDLVDNLFVAVWFASRRFHSAHGKAWYSPSHEKEGWVYLLAVGDASMPFVDLRKHHSSMNTRLQAQHGIAAASQEDGLPITCFDYGQAVAARICFPRSSRFSLGGRFFSTPFLFPKPTLDETFQILLDSHTNDLAADAATNAGVAGSALGRVDNMRYRGVAA